MPPRIIISTSLQYLEIIKLTIKNSDKNDWYLITLNLSKQMLDNVSIRQKGKNWNKFKMYINKKPSIKTHWQLNLQIYPWTRNHLYNYVPTKWQLFHWTFCCLNFTNFMNLYANTLKQLCQSNCAFTAAATCFEAYCSL